MVRVHVRPLSFSGFASWRFAGGSGASWARWGLSSLAVLLCVLLASGLAWARNGRHHPSDTHLKRKLAHAREKITPVIVIMQENRSFDSYFGTYPHADGIRMRHGIPTVCVPDPASGQFVPPFHDPNDVNLGGPHGAVAAVADLDGGNLALRYGVPFLMRYVGRMKRFNHLLKPPAVPGVLFQAEPHQ